MTAKSITTFGIRSLFPDQVRGWLNNMLARIRDTISHSVGNGCKENSMSFICKRVANPTCCRGVG